MFLTDGEPTEGETSLTNILSNVRKRNLEIKVPIYTLAFGNGADFDFLKKLSLRNSAFARKIYEGSDAVVQLENFYSEISTPLLTDVKITYLNDTIVEESTDDKSGTYFSGSEIVTAGKLSQPCALPRDLGITVTATSSDGEVNFIPLPDVEGIEDMETTNTTDDATNFNLITSEDTSHEETSHNLISESNETQDLELSKIGPRLAENIQHHLPPDCGIFNPGVVKPKGEYSGFLDRLYAYLTIENIMNELNRIDRADKTKELNEQALNLSLKVRYETKLSIIVSTKIHTINIIPDIFQKSIMCRTIKIDD